MPFSWTDTNITAKETLVRKVHIDELRSNVDAVDIALSSHTSSTNYSAHPIVTAEHNGLMTPALREIVVTRDADTVDGYQAVDLLNSVPIGTILMWPNNVIPLGFQLCDGTNGTPDLREKFVLGVGATHALHATGGEAAHTLTLGETPTHNHVGLTYTGTGYDNQHEYAPFISSCRTGPCPGTYCPDATTGNAGSGQAHNNLPPFHALYYIQKLTGKMPTYAGDVGPNADRLDGYHAADIIALINAKVMPITRTGINGFTLTSPASYTYINVIISSKFNMTDIGSGSTLSRYCYYYPQVNSANLDGGVKNELTVYKGGDSGHYWGFQGALTSHRMYNTTINAGDVISVAIGSSSLLAESNITVTLSN